MASDPPALPTTATRRPAGSGWLREQPGGVEQVRQGGHPDHPGLAEQGVVGQVAPHRAGPCRAATPAFTATTGLARVSRRASRLKRRALPNDSMYMHTTSVRSSSSQYWRRSLPDTSARLPRATNDEMPTPSLAGLVDDRRADHARLRQQRHPARERDDVRERGVQPHRRVGVEDAEAVRPDDPDAPRPGDAQHLGLEGGALRPGLGEARRTGPPRRTPACGRTPRPPRPPARPARAIDRQVDVVGDVEDARHRPAPTATWSAFGFTGLHRALEAGPLQVADHLVADRCPGSRLAPITATQRGDRSRRTASDAAVPGPGLDGRLGLGGGRDPEPHLDHAVGELGGRLEAGLR